MSADRAAVRAETPRDADFFAAVAARLSGAALCLTPDNAATAVKAATSGMLPCPVLPLSRLMAATAALPNAPMRQLVQAAALGASQTGVDALVWRLYEHLRNAAPGGGAAARFRLAKKLAALFDEMDDHFSAATAAARLKQLADDEPQHENRLAAAAWESLAAQDNPLLCRKNRLLHFIAEKITAPVVAVTDDETTPTENDFCRRIGAKILAAPDNISDDWLATITKTPHCAQASAPTLQETARLALQVIRNHATADESASIGVVVYDRMLARRLRAVAEADGVLIKDNVGWRAETLTIGAALTIFARVILGDFSLTNFLTLLQPPLHAAAADDVAAALARQTSAPPASMEELEKTLYAQESTRAAAALCRTLRAAQRRAPTIAAPQEWMRWLCTESAVTRAAWRHDAVAAALIARLQTTSEESAPTLTGAEFLIWLNAQLERESGGGDSIHSCVEFVPPTTTRRFSALLLLGCTEEKIGDDEGWLGDSARRRLGLPDRLAQLRRRRRRFMRLLAAHQQISAVWQSTGDNGEQRHPYPLWRLLAQRARRDQQLRLLPPPDDEHRAVSNATAPPPIAAARLRTWRRTLSITAADRLMTCPYQFYVGDILRLADKERSVGEEPSYAHIGTLVHRLLNKFSRATADLPLIANATNAAAWHAQWERAIEEETRDCRPFFKIYATFWRDECAVPLIEWERQRRADGWTTEKTEFTVRAVWRGVTQEVALTGRLDRLDDGGDEQKAVIDYKSGKMAKKSDVLNGEAPQLSLYAYLHSHLHGGTVAEQILYNPIKRGGVQAVVVESPRLPRVAARLRTVLGQIDRQAPIPANGAPDACDKCSSSGVCRRAHWLPPDGALP